MKRIILTDKHKWRFIKKRDKLQKKLSEIGPLITGSLSKLYRICGAKYCRCKKGGNKHHALYIVWQEKQITKSLYVPVSMHQEVIEWVTNYKKLKTLIKHISAVQKDILRLR